MTGLYIFLGIILLLYIILRHRVKVDFEYIGGKMKYKVRFMCFTLMDSATFSASPLLAEADKSKPNPMSADSRIAEADAPMPNGMSNEKIRDDPAQGTKRVESTAAAKETTVQNSKPVRKAGSSASSIKKAKTKKERREAKNKHGERESLPEMLEKAKKLLHAAGRGTRLLLKGISINGLYADIDAADEDACEAALKFGRMNSLVFGAVGLLCSFFSVTVKSIDIHCLYNSDKSKYDFGFSAGIRLTTALAASIDFGVKFLYIFKFKPWLASKLSRFSKKRKKMQIA